MDTTAAKRLRLERKLNLATLAKRTGISREDLENFEDSDKKGQLSFTQICALAYALKVQVREICSVDVDAIWVEDPETDIPEEIAEREEKKKQAAQTKTVRLTEKEQRVKIGKLVGKRIEELGISATAISKAGINNVHMILYQQGSPVYQEMYKEKVAKLIGVDVSELEVKK